MHYELCRDVARIALDVTIAETRRSSSLTVCPGSQRLRRCKVHRPCPRTGFGQWLDCSPRLSGESAAVVGFLGEAILIIGRRAALGIFSPEATAGIVQQLANGLARRMRINTKRTTSERPDDLEALFLQTQRRNRRICLFIGTSLLLTLVGPGWIVAAGLLDNRSWLGVGALIGLPLAGFLLWNLFLLRLGCTGLLLWPERTWQVEVAANSFRISNGRRTGTFDGDQVVKARYLFHEEWDGILGIEDVLHLEFANGGRCLVPSSATNFQTLLRRVEEAGVLVREGLR